MVFRSAGLQSDSLWSHLTRARADAAGEQRKCSSPELSLIPAPPDGALADDAIGLHLVDGFERGFHRFILNQPECRANSSRGKQNGRRLRCPPPVRTVELRFARLDGSETRPHTFRGRLCSFASAFAFKRALAADIHLDLLRLSFGFLRQLDI